MRFSENRKIAFVVLAVCVLISVFGFGGMGLARERGKVMEVFDRGSDATASTRQSVDAYLDAAAENARLAASEAELAVGKNQRIDDVAELATQLADSPSLDARYDAFVKIKDKIDVLYNHVLAELGLDSGDKLTADPRCRNFIKAYNDFWEKAKKIKYDDYPQLAAKYNDLISGFPAGVVATLTGQGALNTFGG